MTEGERRRRRVRGTRGGTDSHAADSAPDSGSGAGHGRRRPDVPASNGDAHSAITSDVYDEGTPPVAHMSIGAMASSAHEDRDERSLRGLIGGGSSQVSVRAAMRARDASRPSDADIAAAKSGLTIVHRGWVPRDN